MGKEACSLAWCLAEVSPLPGVAAVEINGPRS